MQNTPRGNWLTIPVALVFLAMALIISTLIFVFAGNSQTQGQASGLPTGSVTNPITVVDGSHENNQDVKRQNRTKPQYSGKGRPGLKGKIQGKGKPQYSGKGRPDLNEEKPLKRRLSRDKSD